MVAVAVPANALEHMLAAALMTIMFRTNFCMMNLQIEVFGIGNPDRYLDICFVEKQLIRLELTFEVQNCCRVEFELSSYI
jgi:hypothetical protein